MIGRDSTVGAEHRGELAIRGHVGRDGEPLLMIAAVVHMMR